MISFFQPWPVFFNLDQFLGKNLQNSISEDKDVHYEVKNTHEHIGSKLKKSDYSKLVSLDNSNSKY